MRKGKIFQKYKKRIIDFCCCVETTRDLSLLQVASFGLFGFDRFEQGLEIAGAESVVIVSLNDLNKQSRPVLYGSREDLEQVAVVVKVDQNVVLCQLYRILEIEILKIAKNRLFKCIVFSFYLVQIFNYFNFRTLEIFFESLIIS